MTNVLIIASDKRMEELRSRFQPRLGALILMVNDFDLGLKEVFEKRPATVFIQDNIDGVSGTTVARHIKTLLREQSPRMVLLTGTEIPSAVVNNWFDDVMPLSGTEQSIGESFKRHLDATEGLVWKENIRDDGVSSVDEPPLTGEPGVILDNCETIVPEPFPTEFPPLPEPEIPHPPRQSNHPDAETKRAALDEAREKLLSPGTLIPTHVAEHEHPPAQVSPPRYRPVSQPSVPVPEEPVWDGPVPHGEPVNGRSLQGSRLWIYGAGFVVAVAISLFVYSRTLFRTAPPPPLASSDTRPAADASSSGGIKLPTFITSGSVDREYGVTHPGWERYLSITGSMEYLVYREGGAIKAIQMISLKEAVIDDSFFRTALRELFGNDTYRATSSSVKKGFLVESGTAAGRADLLVYRKDKSSVPVAVVITIP